MWQEFYVPPREKRQAEVYWKLLLRYFCRKCSRTVSVLYLQFSCYSVLKETKLDFHEINQTVGVNQSSPCQTRHWINTDIFACFVEFHIIYIIKHEKKRERSNNTYHNNNKNFESHWRALTRSLLKLNTQTARVVGLVQSPAVCIRIVM